MSSNYVRLREHARGLLAGTASGSPVLAPPSPVGKAAASPYGLALALHSQTVAITEPRYLCHTACAGVGVAGGGSRAWAAAQLLGFGGVPRVVFRPFCFWFVGSVPFSVPAWFLSRAVRRVSGSLRFGRRWRRVVRLCRRLRCCPCVAGVLRSAVLAGARWSGAPSVVLRAVRSSSVPS